MDFTILLEKSILAAVIFGITLVVAMYSTYAERKVAAFLQDRIGPNRAGPFGLLQPLADGVKFFMKEEITPTSANRFLFVAGPSVAMLIACLTSAVIPWSQPYITESGRIIPLQVANINIGILYMFGLVSVGIYGIMIGGWASNNKYSLIGAIRASSQMISYELGMGLSIVAMIMVTSSVNLNDIIEQQRGFNWNIWYQPLGFVIFLICAFAECNRAPFDLPESETDLVGGYHTEYSSMKLGFYLFAEYINMFVSSALMAALFLGGYNFPFMDSLGLSHNWITVIGIFVFFAKIFFFIFLFMWVRWTLPRFRYDQVMRLGWQVLIPLAIVNILLTGGVLAFYDKF